MADRVDENQGEESNGVNKAADRDPKQTFTGSKPRDGPIRRAQTKMGLEPALLIAMAKGALPPIIGMAAYQNTAWAKLYTTLGYLVCTVSFLSMEMTPRAKFLNSLIKNILSVCVGAAIVLLQIQITVSARQTTTHGPERATVGSSGSLEALEYNAAANTVSGLGLFITVYIANTLRAYRPDLNLQIIIYSMWTIVASTYAPSFPDMSSGLDFVHRLLLAYLTGMAIATGVSLFVLPRTSRQTVSLQNAGFLKTMQVCLSSHGKYLNHVSQSRSIAANGEKLVEEAGRQCDSHYRGLRLHRKKTPHVADLPAGSAEAAKSKEWLKKANGLFGKIQLELEFACQEIAYGKLGPKDLKESNINIRNIFLPVIGLSSIVDIVQSAKRNHHPPHGSCDSDTSKEIECDTNSPVESRTGGYVPDDVLELCQKQFDLISSPLLKALAHIPIRLDYSKAPKIAEQDLESRAGAPPSAGDPKLGALLEKNLIDIDQKCDALVRTWLSKHGVAPTGGSENPCPVQKLEHDLASEGSDVRLVLYISSVYGSISKAVLEAVQWADSKHNDGTMTKRRLITPTWKRTRRVIKSIFFGDKARDDPTTPSEVGLGDSLKDKRKDPEHLAPITTYQKTTNYLRLIPRILGSAESAFGFRAAVATMSIGILAYLSQTRNFFLTQRVQWSLFMIAVSMSVDAGHVIFDFTMRIVGTVIGIFISMLIWYVCDQKTAAIIAVLYIYLFCGLYFVVKYPTYLRAPLISIMCAILLIGYELQVRKIGIELATYSGQPYYPMYELAPYRLASVVAGLGAAFFWVYFPYPQTTRHLLRQNLGTTIYDLASLISFVHTTVDKRSRLGPRAKADADDRSSPSQRLTKTRRRLFTAIPLALQKIQEDAEYTRFEPTVGGKFPKHVYDSLITSALRIFGAAMLMGHFSNVLTGEPLREIERKSTSMGHETTTLLCLLAASLSNAQPLPPYIVSRKQNPDASPLPTLEQAMSPQYAVYSTTEVCSRMIDEEMGSMLESVKELVGEVDFTFQV